MPTDSNLEIGSSTLEFPYPEWSAIETQRIFQTLTLTPIKTIKLLNRLTTDVKDIEKQDSFSYDWETHNMVSWERNINILPKENIDPDLYWSSLLELSETVLSTPDSQLPSIQGSILAIIREKVTTTLGMMLTKNIFKENEKTLELRLRKISALLLNLEHNKKTT